MNKTLKRVVIYGLIAMVLLVIIGYKAGWFSGKTSARPKVDQQGGRNQEALPVSVYKVIAGGLTDRIVATGTVMANEQVILSAEVAGRITAINFIEGREVKKGTVLVTINDTELLAQLEKIKYNQKLAEEREQRSRSLLQKEAISQEEYDRVLTDLNTVKSEASLVEAQLNKAKIIAPFTGTIGLRQVSVGAYVTAGQKIATLTQLQPVKIEFSIPERFAQSVGKDSKVNFSIEGINKKYQASVYAVEPSIDPETRSVSVRAVYPNSSMELRPGSFARIEFELNHMQNAIQVPAQAIIPELSGYKVFRYKSGQAVQSPVTVGIRTTDMVQVTSGLSVGDTVITTGILQLREGLPVILSNLSKK